MKHPCILRLLLLILCASTTLAIAQSTDATISGLVVDPSGRVITYADIEVLNEATGIQYANKTNGVGIYTFSILPPGQYRVQVSKIGFKTLIKPGIILNVQSAVALNFTLPLGATSESITVEAGSALINTTDASVSTVIDRKFVENMPLNGRSFQDLISMTPGVITQSPQAGGNIQSQGDFSVNGSRTESNYYTVDGVSANAGAGYPNGAGQVGSTGSISASTALGTTQSLISVDALQEFRVSSSTYSAEYGRTPGGQFSFSTRSGTNRAHGSVFDYLRNDFFDANDWFNNHNGVRKTALRQNDFGGTLGGPILIPRLYSGTDKSFFFVSYEGLRLVQPTAAATLYVPSQSVRSGAPTVLQTVFNAFPEPTGPEVQIACTASTCPAGQPAGTLVPSGLSPFVSPYSLPSNIDSTSIRLDHKFSDKLSLFFRLGWTPTVSQTRSLSSLTSAHFDTHSFTLGATSQLTQRLTNELRVGYAASTSREDLELDDFGGAQPADLKSVMGLPGSNPSYSVSPYISISGVGTSTITEGSAANQLRQWNITDAVTLTDRRHLIKVGIDYRHIVSPLTPTALLVNPYYYTRQSMVTNSATEIAIEKQASATPVFNEFGAFVQDEWHISSSLSLSLGVRWEVNPPPSEAHGNNAYTLLGSIGDPATLSLAPRGTPLWNTTWYNIAPRLGLAWIAHTQPGFETVVRVGGGVFFDTGNQIATYGFSGLGFYAYQEPTNAPLPVAPTQLNFSTDAQPPYTATYVAAFPAHLQLPYTLQWNTSVQQALGRSQTVTMSYVASSGRRLLQEQIHTVNAINKNFSDIVFFPGGVVSNYQSLQVEFQRSVAHGLQALGSYTWSHSLDDGSSSSSYPFTYGNSNFDVRHSFQSGVSWELPHPTLGGLLNTMWSGWAVDGRFLARTAFPVTLTGNLLSDAVGDRYYSGVNYDPSKPIYVYGDQYPGGRAINGGSTVKSPAFTLPTGTSEGNAPRNFVRGFGAGQMNLALRRKFTVRDNIALQFRAEAFNITNHPNFGYVDPTLSDAQFGQATKMLNQSLGSMSSLYQQGGSRSMQFALKLLF